MRIAALLLFVAIESASAQATGTITGIVMDSVSHIPLRGVKVTLANGSRGVLTSDDGTYTLPDLPAGEVKLQIVVAGYRDIETNMQLAGGDLLKRDFELRPMARITGKVLDRDSGQPIARTVRLMNPGFVGGYSLSEQPPDQSPGFEFTSLEPGDYTLELNASDEVVIFRDPSEKPKAGTSYYGRAPYPETIQLAEGEQRFIDMRVQALEAHSAAGVIELPSGYDAAWLQIGYQEGPREAHHNMGKQSSGTYRFNGLVPGVYRIFAIASEGTVPYQSGDGHRAYGSVTVNITDHDVDWLKIRLAPVVNITGILRMAEDGASLPPETPNLAAILRPSDSLSGAEGVAIAVKGGQFHASVDQGEYWPGLVRLPDGYAVTLSGPSELTFIVTSKPGTVVGTVRDADQAAVKGASVALVPEVSGDPQATRTTESGAGGEFRFKNVPPGKYTIAGARAIEVRPGEAVSVIVVR
jgi:hypothetical protein